jgi:hypothetical protein
MILKEKQINFLLKNIDKKHWDTLSFLISSCTFPLINSPLKYSGPYGLQFQQYPKLREMPEEIKKKYLNFYYPQDMPDRQKAIDYDSEYWPYASVFLVFNRVGDIVGCALYIVKTRDNKLPIENSKIVSRQSINNENFNIEKDRGVFNSEKGIYNSVEIYGLKKAANAEKRTRPSIGHMLFKACVAKSLLDNVEYMYITCTDKLKSLVNMYKNKLAFRDTNHSVTYDMGKTEWKALRRNCVYCDEKLATLSTKHFHLQTFFREGLKKKSFSKQNVGLMFFTILIQLTKIPLLSTKKLLSYNNKGYGEYWGLAYNTLRLFILSFFLSLFR